MTGPQGITLPKISRHSLRGEMTVKKTAYSLLAALATSSLAVPAAQAASANLNVPYQQQQLSNWCWAACAQMIFQFRNKRFAEQCEIAEVARSRNPTSFGATNCCLQPDGAAAAKCNNPNNISQSAGGVGNIFNLYNMPTSQRGRALSYEEVKTEISWLNPIIVFWAQSGPVGHFAVVDGYTDMTWFAPNMLQVLDPGFGEKRKLMAYTAVQSSAGRTWTDTMTSGGSTGGEEQVTLYADANFGGASLKTGTAGSVGAMNDLTSSAKVRGTPYILYTHGNQIGDAWSLQPNDWPSETLWGGTNDSVSSVLQTPGHNLANTIVLFEHSNYNGAYQVITGDNANLHNIGWGDRVSSLIVIDRIWNLYLDASYGGQSYTVTNFGGPNRDGFYPNPASWGGLDDQASSVYYVLESWNPIILYNDINLQGRAMALWQGMTNQAAIFANLTTQGFNDATTSIKTFNGSWWVYADMNQTGSVQFINGNKWYPSWVDWGGTNDAITSVVYSGQTNATP